MPLRTLIVDDEPLAVEGLETRLANDPDIHIVASCTDGREAVAAIRRELPDLVFLDVQMPAMSGFDVVAALEPENMPAIVFVTAHDQHALRAFEVNAFDYLLKPIDSNRLRATVERVKRLLRHQPLEPLSSRSPSVLPAPPDPDPSSSGACVPRWTDRLLVRCRRRLVVVPVAEIIWIEAAGDYAYLYTAQQRFLLRATMSSLERRLDPSQFQRIHRGAIVRLEQLDELRPLGQGEYEVHLRDGTEIKLSRSYREAFFRGLDPGL